MDSKYDVVVVGAGPAGSSASYFLGNNGVNTLLLDKEQFPRQKLCSGGISPRGLRTLDEMNFMPAIEDRFQKIKGARIFAPNGNVIEGTIPETKSFRDYGYVIPRKKLDQMLVNHALQSESVEFRQEEVTDLITDSRSGYVKGIKIKNGDEIYSEVVVLAGGAASRLAERNGLTSGRMKYIMALESWRENVKTNDGKINIYYHGNLLPGYFWVFPEGNGEANVGLGLWSSKKDKDVKIYRLFDEISSSKEMGRLIDESTITQEPKIWPIPYREPCEFPIYDGLIKVGDAGGFANPFTGEGIYYALDSGKFAAIAIADALKKEDVSARGLHLFQELCSKEFSEDILLSHELKRLFNDAPFVNGLLQKALGNPELSMRLQGMLVNVIPKDGILSLIGS